jgi:hypothetical protein
MILLINIINLPFFDSYIHSLLTKSYCPLYQRLLRTFPVTKTLTTFPIPSTHFSNLVTFVLT